MTSKGKIYSYIALVLLLIFFVPIFSRAKFILPSTQTMKLSGNKTTILSGPIFELGYFKPDGDSDRWYLGIWHTGLKNTIRPVWVANRDNPLSTSTGTIKISSSNLLLLDQYDRAVWSTNLSNTFSSRSPLVAEFLDDGNFVLRYYKSSAFLWQSFDFPTDTLLPGMKLGWDRKTNLNRALRSWKAEDDPSTGDYTYKVEIRPLPESVIFEVNTPAFRFGPQQRGVGEIKYGYFNLTISSEEVTYIFRITNTSFNSVLRMHSKGSLQRLTWFPTSQAWKNLWEFPSDQCHTYNKCGPNSYCDGKESWVCNCMEGFEPVDPHAWILKDVTRGCIRKTKLSCGVKEEEVGFLHMKKVILPDTKTTIVDAETDLEQCQKKCIKDCNCTAVAITDVRDGGSGCAMWKETLWDIQKIPNQGQDLFVKLMAVDLPNHTRQERKIIGLGIGLSVFFLLMISFVLVYFFFCKRKKKRATETGRNQGLALNLTSNLVSTSLDFDAIVSSTDNFSDANKIGRGGYGVVYKGELPTGEKIAVKRLTERTAKRIQGLKNEVDLIANVQHTNLVRLFGYCFNATENILVYEFLENSSLDSYIFDKTQSSNLSWEMRYNIISGIARGLLYLHQDSRLRIIHLDLKPNNILLDKDMTPKIGDFGLAKIIGKDQTEANATSVVGTYGYISPEYMKNKVYSVKSDVFSFGVLLLEIVSGKKNLDFLKLHNGDSLIRYSWINWSEGKGLAILDPVIADSSSFRHEQILRCIKIGLLCVQELAEDRPTMSSVCLMLSSAQIDICQPKLFSGSSSIEPADESCTATAITMSTIDPR